MIDAVPRRGRAGGWTLTRAAPLGGVRRPRLAAALLGASALAAPFQVAAEVATDGTLGRRVRLTGPEVEVGAELGRVAGRNLFHSFERFGVEAGGRVTFTGPSGLDNVVSRVTGGEASRIDGTLTSRVPGAAVWLVNPSGILFGPGARLDVPGSFHASTADELRFADGAKFSARDPGASTLSVARPEAFGFLGVDEPAPITVDRSVLTVLEGKTLSLVGGDLAITGGTISSASIGATVLAALGGQGTVNLSGKLVADNVSGEIRLSERAVVRALGGYVSIRAGKLLVTSKSVILSLNNDIKNIIGNVNINVHTLAVYDSKINSLSSGSAIAANIIVIADDLTIREGSTISSVALEFGSAGDVDVLAGTLLLDQADIFTVSEATGGQIRIRATDLILLLGSRVFTTGVRPRQGENLVTLQAPLILMSDDSLVGSVTGDGRPLLGTTALVGVDNDVGTGLQIAASAFLDAGGLLGQTCAARRAGASSTFARAGRGGLPPSPDRPLASTHTASSGQILLPGGILRIASAGCEPVVAE
jgi:filamentous hemagglutinin family protein